MSVRPDTQRSIYPAPVLAQVIPQFIRGFLMGSADIVPGVSGGTVALVVGIYERLIHSIRQGAAALGRLVRVDGKGAIEKLKTVEWAFLIPLGVGILTAVVVLSSVVGDLLDERPVEMAGLFFGLILGSTVIAWHLLRSPQSYHALIATGVAVVAFLALGLRGGGVDEESVSQAANPAFLAFFVAGAVAICAMILPGVSGSFLLVMLGMYEPVLDAVSDRDLGSVLVFGAGCIIGLALFSTLLDRLLASNHDEVLAALIGLMLGSLRVLWPWPGGIDTTELAGPTDPVIVPVVLAVGSAILVVVVGRLGISREAARGPRE
jgi:putative membrane protein